MGVLCGVRVTASQARGALLPFLCLRVEKGGWLRKALAASGLYDWAATEPSLASSERLAYAAFLLADGMEASRGRLMVNVAPFPGLLATLMLPP